MKKFLIVALIISIFAGAGVPNALAAPKKGKVKSLAKQYRNFDRKINRLAKRFNKLSSSQKSNLLTMLGDKYDDSDNDNLPDYLDSGSNRCNSDSDGDGTLDGDEIKDDSSSPTATPSGSGTPTPSATPDSSVEVHALIQSISANAITLDSKTFKLNGNTEYLDDDNNPISRTDFSIGECVEVEGFSSGDNLIAEKVKEDDDC